MRYISTRGQCDPLDFERALLTGLARDGGLYVPERWPTVDTDALRAWRGLSYPQLARRVMKPFVAESLSDDELGRIIDAAYATFDHAAVVPLTQTHANEWLVELYHGPTLAFKDVAMQVLAGCYDHVLAHRDQRVTLIGATSGDTGSAAIEAIRRCERATIFILHPHGRTSEVQRRQMTTVDAPNVFNIAVEGSFDDCQDLVKAMFNDPAFRDEVNMSGVNSINWARVLPQVVYYFHAALALGGPDRPVSFAVPTGNFGDIYAGYVATQMGLPVHRLVVASNINDILTRALHTGEHALASVERTMSPSMDIQISSNFERLLFDVHERDTPRVRELMDQLKRDKRFEIAPAPLERIRQRFDAERVDETRTLELMRTVHAETGKLIDPHTAVGVGAARRVQPGDPTIPMIVLSTAHPAKFPDAVEKATGHRPALPERLADLYEREEHFDVLPANLPEVQQHIRDRLVTSTR